MPIDLCKQEASTIGIRSWKSCVLESLTDERREEVWGERKVSASLHRIVPHPREVWNCGLQVGLTTILSWSSRHLSCVTIKEMFKAPMDIMFPKVIPLEANLSYPEHRTKTLDQKDRVTKRKTIKFFKIQWSNHPGRDFVLGGRAVTPRVPNPHD
jgi:hypothetical protein